jgi:NNMT/PNMT/TEMT family
MTDARGLVPRFSAGPHLGLVDIEPRVLRNADAAWNTFSSSDYWRRTYAELMAEDRELIRHVSHFFASACAGCPPVRRAIDVGAGTNLYPALLMLPWAKQILLADFSKSNILWLQDQLADNSPEWRWARFWREMRDGQGYAAVRHPRKRVRDACAAEPGYAGIEQMSVFDLPQARWNMGTMFFVAESITEDPAEFAAALASFVGALTPSAPFAAAFMAGSNGYPVDGAHFPALPIQADDVERDLAALGVCELTVYPLETSHRVREGYAGMIVATGFAGDASAGATSDR